MKLSEIASALGISFDGEDRDIEKMNDLDLARSDELGFLSEKKYISALQLTQAAAVIINKAYLEHVPSTATALIVEGDVHLAMATVSRLFHKTDYLASLPEAVVGDGCKIAPTAHIDNGAVIGNNVTLMPGVFIGPNARIGDNTVLYPNVAVYRDCKVGDNCTVHASTVIGSDGYGFAHTAQGEHVKIYQNGNVVVEDNVEIGSNCSIDRAVFNTTLIKQGTKLDNLVHIAHNCEIGEHSLITASVIIAGSTKIGRNFVAAGQAGIEGHIEIAPFTTVAAKAGVTNSIKEPGTTVGGFPHMPQRQWLKLQAKLARMLKVK